MAETPKKAEPGLLETVGTATAGALGGTVGSTMGPVGTAVGGIVGQRVGKAAIGLGKRVLGHDDEKAAPDVALASADTAALAPLVMIEPAPLDIPPPDEKAAGPAELLPER